MKGQREGEKKKHSRRNRWGMGMVEKGDGWGWKWWGWSPAPMNSVTVHSVHVLQRNAVGGWWAFWTWSLYYVYKRIPTYTNKTPSLGFLSPKVNSYCALTKWGVVWSIIKILKEMYCQSTKDTGSPLCMLSRVVQWVHVYVVRAVGEGQALPPIPATYEAFHI